MLIVFSPAVDVFNGFSHGSQTIITTAQRPVIESLSVTTPIRFVGRKQISEYNSNRNTLLFCHFHELLFDKLKPYDVDRYKRILIWFDDINPWRISEFRKHYPERLSFLREHCVLLSPVQDYALNLATEFSSAYVNWSYKVLENLDSDDIVASKRAARIYFDYDRRLQLSREIASSCFEKILTYAHAVRKKIIVYVPVPNCIFPHSELVTVKYGRFSYSDNIEILQSCQIYYSSIEGSYEFSLLEARLLGCAVFHEDCVLREHLNGPGIVNLKDTCFENAINLVEKLNPHAIIRSARDAYSTETGISRLTMAVEEVLQ